MIGTLLLTIRGLALAARLVAGSTMRRLLAPPRRYRYARLGDPFA